MSRIDRSVELDRSAVLLSRCWELQSTAKPRTADTKASPVRAPPHVRLDFMSLQRSSKTSTPPDGFEPQADGVLKPSALYLAEKLFKKLNKLRKRSVFPGGCPTIKDQHRKGRHSLERNVERRSSYEDAESELSADIVSTGSVTPTSSSRISSSSLESLVTTDSVISSVAPGSASHTPGSQVMANMLLAFIAALNDDEDIEFEDMADLEADEYLFDGPRESAWHQPSELHELLTKQEWRMIRYGHVQGKSSTGSVVSQISKTASTGTDYNRPQIFLDSRNQHEEFKPWNLPPSSGSVLREPKHVGMICIWTASGFKNSCALIWRLLWLKFMNSIPPLVIVN